MRKKRNSAAVSVISGCDGPTSVFILEGNRLNFKQRLQSPFFQVRRKWFALWIKPNPHTMDEVAAYIQEKYGFKELPKDSKKYRRQYEELRASFIMQYQPELLDEYVNQPELISKDESGVQEFLKQMELRQQKAKEVPEEVFSLEYYYFEKEDDESSMHIQLEAKYSYVGGGASGKNISKYHKIYKDICKYYGVSKEDIENHTERYENLLRTLAIRHKKI